MAICLPGIASKLKRAATSAIRPEPLVITIKLTITKMENIIRPIRTLPPMRKLPKASITAPAASEPVCPSDNISRVDARLSDNRSIVATKRMVGKELKCSGFSMKIAVISTKTEKVMDMVSIRSSNQPGIGMISIKRIVIMPRAIIRSVRMPLSVSPLNAVPDWFDVASLILGVLPEN